MNAGQFAGGVIAVMMIVAMVGFGVNYIVNVEPIYRKAAGSVFDAAYDASTFEVMRDNLLKAIQGLRDLGLTESDYGKAFGFEQTRDWSMSYQYEYLNGLVNRTQYYIDTFKANNTSPFTDIYTKAMENMRAEFGRNGPVDWVAQPAWLLKYHGIYYWGLLVYGPLFLLFLLGAAIVIVSSDSW